MTFPEVDDAPRTDAMFDEMIDEEHHRGDSILRQLKVGMVSPFPLDFMHLVCLGIMRRILLLWMKGPLPTRIGGQQIMSFICFMPREFARTLQTFLLYTGLFALKIKIPDALYSNFLLLHASVTILCSQSMCPQYCDYAEQLLVLFVQHFSSMYDNMVVCNVHGLNHLANDVKKFVPLQNFSVPI